MSRNGRLALIGAALVVAVVAFAVIQSGGDDKSATASVQSIKVSHGKPIGGVQKITVTKGETLRLTVSSPDTSQEIHVHGYDLERDMAPGRPASFEFKTRIEGVFEIELEDTATRIASLQMRPG